MAGFVAVIGSTPQEPAGELDRLARCYAALRHEREQARLTAGERGGVVAFGAGPEPGCTVHRSPSGWSVHLGTVFAPPSGPVDAPAQELDGQFALVRFLAAEAQPEVLSDPFALQALYVAERGGVTYLSTSVLALARHLLARPSRLGIEVFLRGGPHFGELTSWEGIARLPPATQIVWDRDGRARRTCYWRPAVDPAVRALGAAAAARHCVEASVAALTERYGRVESAWCDLTGGFDSRLTAVLLHRAGARFTAHTVGPPHARDVVLGAQVAAAAGWLWESNEPVVDGPDWRTRVDHAIAWGDGHMEVVQLAAVLRGHQGRAGAARTVFAGGGGEHWRDYAWQQEGPFGGRTPRFSLRRWVDMRFLQPLDTSPFISDPTDRVRENLMERCEAYLQPYAGELGATQLEMLYAYKSMGHFGAYATAARGILCTELPMYAKPVYDAVFSVNPAHRVLHRLMRRAIALVDPRIAALPTTTGGPAEPLRAGNAVRFLPYLANRARGAARKITQRLPGPTLAAMPDIGPSSERDLRARLLADLLERTGGDPARLRSGALYDGHRLPALLRGPDATGAAWPVIGRIITAELALEAADAHLE